MLAIVTRRNSLLARLSATMEDTADRKVFDTDGYLATRYGDTTVKDRLQFLLDGHHEVFQSLPYSLKVLDFGSGPVIQHCISAAPHASEIVFSDIAESNREAVRKWLGRDPTAFNWSPHFDYVVQTLEGKGEKEAREREEMLRKCTIFRVLHGLCYFPQNVFSARETRSHVCRPLMLTHPFARTNSYFYSFVPHSILQWNNLPEHVISSSSIHSFKESLMHYLNSTYN